MLKDLHTDDEKKIYIFYHLTNKGNNHVNVYQEQPRRIILEYDFPGSQVNKADIGQTGRNLGIKVTEHKRAIMYC